MKARVVRISLIAGEVNLKRNGNQDWERRPAELPTRRGRHDRDRQRQPIEIQVDSRNFVRACARYRRCVSSRCVTRASPSVWSKAQPSCASQSLIADKEYFEIDAPRTTLAAEKRGLYRIDVPRDGRVSLTVRDGGKRPDLFRHVRVSRCARAHG